MSDELAPNTSNEIDRGVHHAGETSRYSDHERDILRALGGLDEASDGDLAMLKAVADRTGLDPFAKQIYLIGRKTKTGGYRGEPERWETKWTVQTSIDGFREVTRRYGQSLGQAVQIGAPSYYKEDGTELPFWLNKWGYPVACKVEVRVGDSIGYGLATWDEFVQTKKNGEPNSMWAKMGPTMLAKCAEAQAHRKVCSLTAGMYVDEEMMQADNRVSMTATRQDVAQQALSAPEPKKKQEPKPEPEVVDDDLINDVREALGSYTTLEEVNRYAKRLKQDGEVLAEVQQLVLARWAELGGEK